MNPCTANSCNKTGNNTGDELLCAVVITETMYYVHKDYLGSISAITDASPAAARILSRGKKILASLTFMLRPRC
jgi:hypothetical protein